MDIKITPTMSPKKMMMSGSIMLLRVEVWYSTSRSSFVYSYDALNRLTQGRSADNKFIERGISYDLMGNINTLSRVYNSTLIDSMAYAYNSTNQLQSVYDKSPDAGVLGYKTGNWTYAYDGNGNMITDNSKGISKITYNLLNLPQSIAALNTTYTYDAGGQKLRRVIGTATTDYIDGIEYDNGVLAFIQTEEGRALPNGTTLYNYEYSLSDHLGDERITFDTHTTTPTIVQQDNYMPFGMDISVPPIVNPQNNYLYNKKELQQNLQLYDYGARFYDPVIVRFNVIDRYAEKYSIISPYQYAADNPIKNIDKNGDSIIVTANLKKDYRIWDSFRTLERTSLGKAEVKKFQNSTSNDIYLSKENSTSPGVFYTYGDIRSKKFVSDDKVNTKEMANPHDFASLNGHKIKPGHRVSIIAFNEKNASGLDVYELAFAIYHELRAHVDNTTGDAADQHKIFGDTFVPNGLVLHDGIFINGDTDYYVTPGTDAWKIFEQILALKVSDGHGTEQNKKDLEEMKKVDENANKGN